jgi:hypothetical protein
MLSSFFSLNERVSILRDRPDRVRSVPRRRCALHFESQRRTRAVVVQSQYRTGHAAHHRGRRADGVLDARL